MREGSMGTFKQGVHREEKPGRFAGVLRRAAAKGHPVTMELRRNCAKAVQALYNAVMLGAIRVTDETADVLTAAALADSWPGNGHVMIEFWLTERLNVKAFLAACNGDVLALRWRDARPQRSAVRR